MRTLRLTGIGESVVAERLGDALLRADNPSVATYARQEAVDVRISARAADGAAAAAIADEAEALVRDAVGEHVWGHGATTWAAALADALGARGWTLATTERGTDGALVQLLRALPAVVLAERRAAPEDDSQDARDDAGDLAEAERVRAASRAPTWASRSARGRAATTRSSTSRSRPPRAPTPSGGSRSCAGARARTGRRSPARRPCWRRSGRGLTAG